MRTVLGTALRTASVVVVLFVLAVLVDLITPLTRLARYLDQHPEPHKTITIAVAAVGWTLMVGVFASALWTRGRPMSDETARQFMRAGVGRRPTPRYFRGRTTGREFRREATFRQIKEAWQSGAWRQDSSWWPIFIGLLATPLIAFGMFGFFVVIGPPLAKVLCAAAVVYATVRTVWGFWKA